MSDQQVPQEPAVTYEHVIGVKELEIFMLRREVATLQAQLQALQEAEPSGNGNGSTGPPVANRAARRAEAKKAPKSKLAAVSSGTAEMGDTDGPQ